ncbi:DapH/DapD/GlmU-related protein [Pseudoalteromonas sp. YIC-656]|uniref:DapH/DapD/GlmU-related protein n=1 Tax=Pseudoalteromonas pernae TaxID=3118054 RepID=UPI0032429903
MPMKIKKNMSILAQFKDCSFHNFDCEIEITGTDFTWGELSGSMVLATARKYFVQATKNPKVACIIAPELFTETTKSVLITSEASALFHQLHNDFIYEEQLVEHFISEQANISPRAHICSPVHIDNDVTIEAGAYIGANTILESGVYIGPNCTIGTEGMLPKMVKDKKIHIKHFGGVKIKSGSHIHANSNVSRALHFSGLTQIGEQCHVGIGVNIAHDVVIGDRTEISGHTNIAGRTTIGENVWIGANSTLSNHLHIGDNAKIRLGSTVIESIAADEDVSGNFALSHQQNLRLYLSSKLK